MRDISTDFIHKLVPEAKDGNAAEGEQRDGNNLYPLLMSNNEERDLWNNGNNISTYLHCDNKPKVVEHKRILIFHVCFRGQGFNTT